MIATIVSTLTSPTGVSVTPNGKKVYVATVGFGNAPDNVSVIATETNTIIDTITVGRIPISLGVFIGSAPPRFAGIPGKANCYGRSVSALAQQHGGLNNAAADLEYSSISALQDAIMQFCLSS